MTRVVISPNNVANFPEGGGHFWVYLQYVTGLRRLGCDVVWLERFRSSGDASEDRSRQQCLVDRLKRYGMGVRPFFYSGRDIPAALEPELAGAELLLNFQYDASPELLARFRRTALIDIDPGLLQHWIAQGEIKPAAHDLYFTTGETVGQAGSKTPDAGLPWHKIRPPVDLESWPLVPAPADAPYTTVSSWMGGVDGEWVSDGEGGFYDNNKRVAFLRLLELPGRVRSSFELALCLDESAESQARAEQQAYADYQGDRADRAALERHGWRVRHAYEVAGSPERYRQYIRASRGEFSCVKPSCVRFQNAWISDRTLCYLASGRPAIVEDTGPSAFLSNGEGLLRFHDLDGAVSAIERVEAHYERQCEAARALAEAHFDAGKVLTSLVDRALS
jgi:hypothetical protein